MRNLVQSTLDGIAIPYMAESDSQKDEIEELDSSKADPIAPNESEGEGEETVEARLDEMPAQSEMRPDESPESFDENVAGMLDAIEIDQEPEEEILDEEESGPVIDALLSSTEDPEQAVASEEDAEAIQEEIEDAFSDEDDDQGSSGDPLPTPEELLIQAGKVLNGEETEIPEADEGVQENSASEESFDGLAAMPDPQSLMQAAAEDEEEATEEEPSVDDSSSQEDGGESSKLPSPDDVLKQAAAILDSEEGVAGSTQEGAQADFASMPDPQSLMNQA